MDVTTISRQFLDTLLSGARPVHAEGLAALRSHALERANALSVPTTRDEAWRFTDLAPLYRLALKRPVDDVAMPSSAAIASWIAPEVPARLVFVDGRFAPALSAVPASGSTSGLTVTTLAAAMAAGDASVQAHVGRLAAVDEDLFTAVNTAWLRDGAFVRAGRGVPGGSIHCLFIATQADVVQHPRVLVVAEDGAEVTLIEDYVSMQDAAYCVNAVAEIAVGANARVRHVKVQRDGAKAFHLATTAVSVQRDGFYGNLAVTFGGRISRNNVNIRQEGTGTEFELDGLAFIDGRSIADTHSFVDHAHAHGRSRQLHKCVVAGGAHAVFNGRILVREGAQKTDSTQESRNILLSEKAHVDAKPQLEIFADDVKCAHGATVGQLEAEEVFYLMSRGLSESTARNLLTYGFAADVVNRIPIASIVKSLAARLLEHTGGQEIA
jgi:Fe-S cluster assembly protein SufD